MVEFESSRFKWPFYNKHQIPCWNLNLPKSNHIFVTNRKNTTSCMQTHVESTHTLFIDNFTIHFVINLQQTNKLSTNNYVCFQYSKNFIFSFQWTIQEYINIKWSIVYETFSLLYEKYTVKVSKYFVWTHWNRWIIWKL